MDRDWPEAERPNAIGTKTFGAIAIAKAECGATADIDVDVDQAFRAVYELVTA